MDRIEGVLRAYDWGSPTVIPEFLGRPSTGEPVAELWFGAHPSAPSLAGDGRRPLDRVIAADPVGHLGAEIASRFGSLPFLVKVLAAARPLSLQVHPSASEAEAGFAREEEAGVPIDAPERTFRDPRHKPELICALAPFEALCGFRPPAATLALLDGLTTPALDPVRHALRGAPDGGGLRDALGWLLTRSRPEAGALVAETVAACHRAEDPAWLGERSMALELAARYPDDAGVVTSLLLNRVVLAPGEALFLGSGTLHAYLGGVGVEVMANSDNVVRGGLTSKHVDVPVLLDIVDTEPTSPDVQRPAPVAGVVTYRSPVPEFELQRIEVAGETTIGPGPSIVVCTEGRLRAGSWALARGAALWIDAADEPVTLTGSGTVFRTAGGRR